AYRRPCGNGTGRSGAYIPHRGDKRKQAVLGARHAEVTLCSQMRGGLCHVRLDRLPPPQTATAHRSTPCPHAPEPPHTTRKPDGGGIARRPSVLPGTAARRSTPPSSWSKRSMTWAFPDTWWSKLRAAGAANSNCWGRSSV